MYFVKLTTPSGESVVVNFDLVTNMTTLNNFTIISFGEENNYVGVKETPEEILSLAPILKS